MINILVFFFVWRQVFLVLIEMFFSLIRKKERKNFSEDIDAIMNTSKTI